MLMDYQLHDYVAWFIAIGAVILFVILLVWNGYDDYRNGRLTSTWRKPNE